MDLEGRGLKYATAYVSEECRLVPTVGEMPLLAEAAVEPVRGGVRVHVFAADFRPGTLLHLCFDPDGDGPLSLIHI